MSRQLWTTAKPGMPLARLMSRSHATIALAYLASYVLLDWGSYVHPFATFGITPWNPHAGLTFALILLFGFEFFPWLFVAPLLADLFVRGLPLPIAAELLVVLITGMGYGGAAMYLRSSRIGFDPALSSKRSLLWLMAVAIVSISGVASGHVLVLLLHGIVAPADFLQAAVRAFVGDLIGVMVFTPFLLIVFTRRRFPAPSWEMGLVAIVILAALWGVFGFPGSFHFQLFYVLFIPIVWIAVRFGLEGVALGLVLTQVGLIVAIQISGGSTLDVLSYQALMAVLAITGLAIGVLVNEQARTHQQLRLHQEALHRAARIGTMGEFAAAVAHEINQPLTAIANYSRLAKRAAEQMPPDTGGAIEAASSAIEQVDRAATVVHRLRDFIRLGRIEVKPIAVSALVKEAYSLCRPELDRYHVECQMQIARDLPPVAVDALQIEQVLLNLLRNAKEALVQAGRHDGRIIIEATQGPSGHISIRIVDNGPGLDPGLVAQPITPFTTTKSDGLGLGLSLARSIVEAHGGKLSIESGPRGVSVSFTLPTAASGGLPT